MLRGRSLQRTLNELREYQKKHEYWQQQQEKLLTEQAPSDTKFEQRFAYEQLKVNQAKAERGKLDTDIEVSVSSCQ